MDWTEEARNVCVAVATAPNINEEEKRIAQALQEAYEKGQRERLEAEPLLRELLEMACDGDSILCLCRKIDGQGRTVVQAYSGVCVLCRTREYLRRHFEQAGTAQEIAG